ncbi:MAG: orotidine-5'-phosphate decarboxylase [Phycisphaerales bacterium]
MTDTPATRADALVAAIDRAGSPACVGLDPVLDRLPDEIGGVGETDRIESFCAGVIDAVADAVGIVKPQSACFERHGSAGFAVLERTIARAKAAGLLVVLDAKRGDIGTSSAHYAAAAAGMGADWVTVSPYLGASGIDPFLDAGLGVFVLVRTSNPDSEEIQAAPLAAGPSVSAHVASIVARAGAGHVGASGVSGVGAVVGATKSSTAGAELRAVMPDQPFLIPGVGAQGGTADDVRALARPNTAGGRAGVVVNASRSVLYPEREPGEDWRDAVARSARELAAQLRDALA